MLPLILLVVGVGFFLFKGSGHAGGSRILAIGHRYSLVLRTDVHRAGASFDAQNSLIGRLTAAGFTGVFLTPSDADVDPFVWRATGVWSGARPALVDSPGLLVISVADQSGGNVPAQGAPQPPPPPQQQIPGGKYDRGLDPNLETTVDRMLANESNPNELRRFAATLRPDFPIAAGALETKANALAFVTPAGVPNVIPNPFGGGPISAPPPPPPPPAPSNPFQPPANPFGSLPMPSLPATIPGTSIPLPSFPIPPPPPAPAMPTSSSFDPGPLPPLPPIPGAGGVVTTAHKAGQRGLVAWAAQFAPGTYSTRDVDGSVGPKTQKTTQIFQAWSNRNRGTNLMLDGLFGPMTYAALSEFST